MAIVLDWKKRLGYRNDPFRQVIFKPVGKYAVGTEHLQERLSLFLIRSEKFGTVSGPHGSGKTTLLRWVQEELASKRELRPHYVDGKEAKNYDDLFAALLPLTTLAIKERLGKINFLKKKLGKRLEVSRDKEERVLLSKLSKRGHLLLIDNAGCLKEDALTLVSQVLEKTPAFVIMADTKERLKAVESKFTDKLKVKTPSYTKEHLSELLRLRIEHIADVQGTHPFEDVHIKDLAKKSSYNPQEFLKLASERAIELSLKAQEVPKARKAKKSSKKSGPRTKKLGFFNIEIQRGPQKPKKSNNDLDFLEDALKGDIEDLKKDVVKSKPPPSAEEVILDHSPESDQIEIKNKRPRKRKPSDSIDFDALLHELEPPNKKTAKKSAKKTTRKKAAKKTAKKKTPKKKKKK